MLSAIFLRSNNARICTHKKNIWKNAKHDPLWERKPNKWFDCNLNCSRRNYVNYIKHTKVVSSAFSFHAYYMFYCFQRPSPTRHLASCRCPRRCYIIHFPSVTLFFCILSSQSFCNFCYHLFKSSELRQLFYISTFKSFFPSPSTHFFPLDSKCILAIIIAFLLAVWISLLLR